MKAIRLGSISLLLVLACSPAPSPSGQDGGSGTVDAGAADAGSLDAGAGDAGSDGGSGPVLSLFSITPQQGMAGESFVIAGINIAQGAQVFFANAPVADAMTSSDGTSISGTVPQNTSASTTVPISVVNAPGLSATLPNAFTYVVDKVTWCKLYPPTALKVVAGATTPTLTAEVKPASVAAAGQSAPTAQVGYGDASTPVEQWNWSPAQPAEMPDGSNGVYTGTLTPSTPGSYHYAFRFTNDGVTYLYCDTNGTDQDPPSGFQVAASGSLVVDQKPTITGFTPTHGKPGDTVTITGTNLIDGLTVSFGSATAMVTSVASDGTSASVVVPDGLGSVSIAVTIDGEAFPAPGMFSYDVMVLPSWCVIDAPTNVTVFAGDASPALNGEVYAMGLTPNDGTGVAAQIGYGATGSDPSTWTWADATFSKNSGNNDVFAATLTPTAAGSVSFVYRFSVDGTDYAYCDTSGPASAVDATKAGTITVVAKPTITGVQPTHGIPGNTVTITGTNLTSDLTYSFGSNAATGVMVSADGTTATVIVPAGSGAVAVSASANGDSVNWSGQFTYDQPVSWCRLNAPTTASVVAGTPSPALFGEVYQPNLTPNNGTGITGQVGYGDPMATPDTWAWSNVTFSSNDNNNDIFTGTLTPAMTGTYAFAFRFTVDGVNYAYCDSIGLTHGFDVGSAGVLTVVGAPTIASITPASGQPGNEVTITGTNLTTDTTFAFGGTAASVVSISSDGTKAIVTVPTGTGSVPVTATLSGSQATWSGQFTYGTPVNWCKLNAPTTATVIAGQSTPALSGEVYQPSVTPNNGAGITGQVGYGSPSATPDTWTWTNASFSSNDMNNDVFTGVLSTSIPGSYAYAFRFSVDGTTYAYCDSFGLTHGFEVASAGTLTVLRPPVITGLQPAHGKVGDMVTISGSGFAPGTTFTFGGTAAQNVKLSSDGTSATVTVPVGSGTVAVLASLMGVTSSSVQFTYDASPIIVSLSPTFMSVKGGQLTINGTGFSAGAPTVSIGGQPATLVGTPTDTQIVVTAPAENAPGPQQVVVTAGAVTSNAVMLPYVLKFTITPDGDLSDWPAAALVGSSSTASEWGTTNSLTKLYMGYDTTNIYIGIQGQAEAANAIIGYLSLSNLTWGSGDIKDTLKEHNPSNDAIGDDLSSGFTVSAPGFLAQYGFGLFGTAPNLVPPNTVAPGLGVRRFQNTTNYDWVTSTVAQSSTSGTNGVEFAIPWQTAGNGSDLFVPFPTGSSNPLEVSAFVRLVCCSGMGFPSQSLPNDPNLQPSVTDPTTRASVSTVATIEVR